MKCSKCGRENLPGIYACEWCHEPIDPTKEDSREVESGPPGAIKRAEPDKESKSAAFFCITAPVLNEPLQLLKACSYTIGRDQKNHIVIPTPSVSRLHAEIYWASGFFWIEDMNSKNGTYINGCRIHRERLKDEDKIDIGRFVLTFRAFRNAESARAELAGLGRDMAESTGALPLGTDNFSGNLEEIPTIELLQLLIKNNRTGIFKVWTEDWEGEIDFLEGNMIHSQIGHVVVGEEAVERILGLQRGKFQFEDCLITCPQTIHLDNVELMRRVLRRLKKKQVPEDLL
jgi:pSer/pThr/pTyr-binding forkhead associated (FHA) protein